MLDARGPKMKNKNKNTTFFILKDLMKQQWRQIYPQLLNWLTETLIQILCYCSTGKGVISIARLHRTLSKQCFLNLSIQRHTHLYRQPNLALPW